MLKELLSSTRYRGLENPSENTLTEKKFRKLVSDEDTMLKGGDAPFSSGGYLGGLDFISVKKINTNSIDFVCRNIISSDGHKSLMQYVIDFTKLISSSAGSKLVEIVFFDQDVIDMFCFIHPKLEHKIEPLARFDRMISFRSDPLFETRESGYLRSLHVALSDFYKKNSINYRHNSFFIPIQFDWMRKGCVLIGTVIIMDPSRKTEHILQTTEREKTDVKTAKMVVSARSTKAINAFANTMMCELKARYSEKEFNSLLDLSRLC